MNLQRKSDVPAGCVELWRFVYGYKSKS